MRRLALVTLTAALAACATPGSDGSALVEIETVAPPSRNYPLRLHVVTVAPDASIERRSHHWRDEPTSRTEPEVLSPEQMRALRDLLASPVAVEHPGVALDTSSQFRITAHGPPAWALECNATEVHRCPIAFLKLWQSLDEIIGDLPER